jgi:hypothetical protein
MAVLAGRGVGLHGDHSNISNKSIFILGYSFSLYVQQIWKVRWGGGGKVARGGTGGQRSDPSIVALSLAYNLLLLLGSDLLK